MLEFTKTEVLNVKNNTLEIAKHAMIAEESNGEIKAVITTRLTMTARRSEMAFAAPRIVGDVFPQFAVNKTVHVTHAAKWKERSFSQLIGVKPRSPLLRVGHVIGEIELI